MKGVIFNAAAEAVIKLGGEDLWDELLDAAGLDGSYTTLGNYSDDDLIALVVAASEKLGMTVDATTEFIGEQVFPGLSGRHMHLVEEHESTVSLLCALNEVIHPEVLKLYPDASVPDFTTLERGEDRLKLLYRSQRDLPALAAGLIRGAANLFDEDVAIDITPAEDGHVFDLQFSAKKVGEAVAVQ